MRYILVEYIHNIRNIAIDNTKQMVNFLCISNVATNTEISSIFFYYLSWHCNFPWNIESHYFPTTYGNMRKKSYEPIWTCTGGKMGSYHAETLDKKHRQSIGETGVVWNRGWLKQCLQFKQAQKVAISLANNDLVIAFAQFYNFFEAIDPYAFYSAIPLFSSIEVDSVCHKDIKSVVYITTKPHSVFDFVWIEFSFRPVMLS